VLFLSESLDSGSLIFCPMNSIGFSPLTLLLNTHMNNGIQNSSLKFSCNYLFQYLTLLLFLGFTGCETPAEKSSEKKVYYDLNGLIEKQITFLQEKTPVVRKEMRVSGKSESRSTKEVDWKKELELFIQADINKPAYSKSYLIEKPDSLTLIYQLKSSENLHVKYLKVQLNKLTGNPDLIQAKLRSENKLYQSEKNIELHGKYHDSQWVITDYSIRGYQKLATMERKDFAITAQVQN